MCRNLFAAQRKGYTISEIRYSVVWVLPLSDNKKNRQKKWGFYSEKYRALQAEAKETGSGTLKRSAGPCQPGISRVGGCNYRSRIIFHYRNRSCIVYRTSYHTFLYRCSHRLLFFSDSVMQNLLP